MADWFSELVEHVAGEVVGSEDTASRLTLTDRVSLGALAAAAIGSEDELRLQFSRQLGEVQEVRNRIEQAERAALASEWRRVESAQGRVAVIRAGPSVSKSRLERFRSWLHLSGGGISLEEAQQAAESAMEAFTAAKSAKKISQSEPVRQLEAVRSEQLSALREPLRQALTLKVNTVIDDAVEASYRREFSYAEPAVLTDPLAVSTQPVDTAAYRKVRYFIDRVGAGTIGVAGTRGSGKSTLLSRFAATVKVGDQPRQWGVCVPAPAKYDPREFLLFLFAQLCLQVLGRERADQLESRLASADPPAAVRTLLRPLLFTAAAALACFGVVIGLRTAWRGEPSHVVTDWSITACCAVVLAAILVIAVAQVWLVMRILWTPTPLLVSLVLFRRIADDNSAFGITRVLPARWLAIVGGLAAASTTTLVCLLTVGIVPDPGFLVAAGSGVASAALFVVLIMPSTSVASARAARRYRRQPYLSEAEHWYARVKFQQTYTTGWSGTVTVGFQSLPFQAQGGGTGSAAVTPLAMSTPELIAAFRSFTESLARSRRGPEDTPLAEDIPEAKIPVIIGIDEIDKIEDPQDAQEFLNQIKGLFGDSSCLFLVSISDDAMAAYERRGMPFRDAFDSSLSTVIVLSTLSRKEARVLTGSRLVGVQEPVADLLFALSGGLARDLVRLIRRAVEAKEQGKTKLDDLALALITAEVSAKKAAVLARAGYAPSCPAHAGLLNWATTPQGSPASAQVYFSGLLTNGMYLRNLACDGSAHSSASRPNGETARQDACTAAEIGAFCFWVASVGQVFTTCSDREDFRHGEDPDSSKSYERLTEARQNFSLGPDYVNTATLAVRKAWGLPDSAPIDQATQTVPANGREPELPGSLGTKIAAISPATPPRSSCCGWTSSTSGRISAPERDLQRLKGRGPEKSFPYPVPARR